MKKLIYAVLILLWGAIISCLVILGIDIEVARKDYVKLKENGDYEQKVEGCIFGWVCEKYTRELQK